MKINKTMNTRHNIRFLGLIAGLIFYCHHATGQKLPDLIPFKEDKLYGYCDSNLNVIIKAKYQGAHPFVEDRARVVINNLNGFIDKDGNQIVPCNYKYASSFYNGYAKVGDSKEDFKFINAKGEYVPEPFQWERLKRNFYEYDLNYLSFEENGKKGVMDRHGNIIVPAKYDQVRDVTADGYAALRVGNEYIKTDSTGRRVDGRIDLSNLNEDRFYRNGNQNFPGGYITISGDTIISRGFTYPHYSESHRTPDGYDRELQRFYEGRAVVSGKERWFKRQGYIDLNGNLVVDTIYDIAFNFKEGRAKVKLNGKYGFIDKNGNQITDIKYDQACYYYGGRAQVMLNGKCGYIDLEGNEVIPLIYDYWQTEQFSCFKNGFVRVRINEKFGILDRNGKAITPVKYDDIKPFENKRAVVKLDDKYGVIDENGNEVIPPVYDALYRLDQYTFNIHTVPYNRQQGLINMDGKIILPMGEDRIRQEENYGDGLYMVSAHNRFSYLIDKYGTKYVK